MEPDETPLQESNKTVPLDLSLPAIVTVSPHTHTTKWSLWYSLVSLVQYFGRQVVVFGQKVAQVLMFEFSRCYVRV